MMWFSTYYHYAEDQRVTLWLSAEIKVYSLFFYSVIFLYSRVRHWHLISVFEQFVACNVVTLVLKIPTLQKHVPHCTIKGDSKKSIASMILVMGTGEHLSFLTHIHMSTPPTISYTLSYSDFKFVFMVRWINTRIRVLYLKTL